MSDKDTKDIVENESEETKTELIDEERTIEQEREESIEVLNEQTPEVKIISETEKDVMDASFEVIQAQDPIQKYKP